MPENSNRQLAQESDGTAFDIYSAIRALLKDWWMILTAGIIGILIAYVAADAVYTPIYTSSMTFIVSSKGATSNSLDLTAANEMAETFGEVLNSRLMKKRVQEELDLDNLPGKIETKAAEGTNLITLKVSAGSPEHAFKIMKSVLNNYPDIMQHVLSGVVLDVLEAPKIPMEPSNPLRAGSIMRNYALIGMAAMAVLLVLIDYLKDDIKNERDVERKLDAPLFGTIYHEAKGRTFKSRLKGEKKALLVTEPGAGFMFVESYKKIRTKLIYRTGQEKGKVILVTSVMENEGKSTVAANIALTLARKNEKVVLIDGDMRKPAVYKIFEEKPEREQEIGSYLKGDVPLKKVLYYDRAHRLHLLTGTKSYQNSTELVAGERMQKLLQAVKKQADYVIIDSPPVSLMADTEILAEYADVSLLVVRQGKAGAGSINDAADMLEGSHSRLLGCIFNDVKTGIFCGKKVWTGYDYGKYRYNRYADRYGRAEDMPGENKKRYEEKV